MLSPGGCQLFSTEYVNGPLGAAKMAEVMEAKVAMVGLVDYSLLV